jgi:electron transport complex protein RnfG
MKTSLQIALCLAMTCLLAAAVLGVAYYFTEPVRQAEMIKSEARLVRKLLELGEGSTVTEVRRYIQQTPQLHIGYLLPQELRIVDGDGKFLKSIPMPESLSKKSVEDVDRWVASLGGGQYAGRFFVGKKDGKLAGYVTESSHYGFKSHIRFFVALTPDFQIRGVEVVSHEEDPGLGAEMTKPQFKNQFSGRTSETLPELAVVKEPLPEARRQAALARGTMPYEAWVAQHGAPSAPIYAVTGATISSSALTEGVKEAVAHLKYRLGIAMPEVKR